MITFSLISGSILKTVGQGDTPLRQRDVTATLDVVNKRLRCTKYTLVCNIERCWVLLCIKYVYLCHSPTLSSQIKML